MFGSFAAPSESTQGVTKKIGFAAFSAPTTGQSIFGSSVERNVFGTDSNQNKSIFSKKDTHSSSDNEEENDDERDSSEGEPQGESRHSPSSKLMMTTAATGEENDETLFSIRSKLYILEEGRYRERGIGQVKINMASDQDESSARDNNAIYPRIRKSYLISTWDYRV
jgi:Ran-binding protein 3